MEKSMAPGLLPVAVTGAAPVIVTDDVVLALKLSVPVTLSVVWPMSALTCWKKLLAASRVAMLLFTLTPVMTPLEGDALPLTSTGLFCG